MQLPLPARWPPASPLLPLPPSHPVWLRPASLSTYRVGEGDGPFLTEVPRALDTTSQVPWAHSWPLSAARAARAQSPTPSHFSRLSRGPQDSGTSVSLRFWPSPQHVPTPTARPLATPCWVDFTSQRRAIDAVSIFMPKCQVQVQLAS